MFPRAVQSLAQIIGRVRRAQQIPVPVQYARLNFQNRLRLFQRGGDVFGFAALQRVGAISLCFQKGMECLRLSFVHHALRLFAAAADQQVLRAVFRHALHCVRDGALRLLQLKIRQRMRHSACPGLRFLPAGAVIANKIRGGRVAQLMGKEAPQQARLPDVRAVVRSISESALFRIPLLGRNIVVLLRNALIEPLRTAPDGFQLRVLQRRSALCRALHKCCIGFFRIAIALEHAPREMRQCAVAATLGNGRRVRRIQIPEGFLSRLRVVQFETFVQRD